MSLPRFEIQSYIGSEIAEFHKDADKPPRSAKFVASVHMGGGPSGGDHRILRLSADRARAGWILWAISRDYETGQTLYCRLAYGEPYKGISAREAAIQLVAKELADEVREGASCAAISVAEAGLLTAQDFRQIVEQIA